MNSVNKHSKNRTGKGEAFKALVKDILIASTEGAYLSSYEDMKALISSDETLKNLLTWLSWWHDRGFNIFRAYTGHLKPPSNQSEVIHDSWVNRGDVGLSLSEATEFDSEDSLILEPEISYYSERKAAFGSGPTMVETRNAKQTLEICVATKKGEDLIKRGFCGKSVSRVSPELHMSNQTEGCEPKERKFFFEIMCQNRKIFAEEEKAKIKARKFRNISQ